MSKKRELVYIRWQDIVSSPAVWQDVKDLKRLKLETVEEVGFVICENKKTLTISSQLGQDHKTVGSGTVIPKSVIIERRKLKYK